MTNNVVEAVVHIEGTRSLLWHAFTPEAIPLERKEKTGVVGNDPVEWQRTVMVDASTRLLYIPGTYAFSCIKEGGKYIKKGRSSYQPIIIATLLVLDDAIFIDDRCLPEQPTTDPDQPVYLDVRGVRSPATRGMNVKYWCASQTGKVLKVKVLSCQ
jgi:hypothetical protein